MHVLWSLSHTYYRTMVLENLKSSLNFLPAQFSVTGSVVTPHRAVRVSIKGRETVVHTQKSR